MGAYKRIFLALRGGVICAILGSLLGGSGVVLISAIRGNFVQAAVSLIPIAFVYAAVTGIPFGFVAGIAGTLWIAARAQQVSGKRLYYEAAGAGALIGALYPLALMAFGWGPLEIFCPNFRSRSEPGSYAGWCLSEKCKKDHIESNWLQSLYAKCRASARAHSIYDAVRHGPRAERKRFSASA